MSNSRNMILELVPYIICWYSEYSCKIKLYLSVLSLIRGISRMYTMLIHILLIHLFFHSIFFFFSFFLAHTLPQSLLFGAPTMLNRENRTLKWMPAAAGREQLFRGHFPTLPHNAACNFQFGLAKFHDKLLLMSPQRGRTQSGWVFDGYEG